MYVSIITLHMSYFTLYSYKIREQHKYTSNDLTKGSQLLIGGGLGRVDTRKGSDTYSDSEIKNGR